MIGLSEIDAVYTWVDGNDLEHARLRRKYSETEEIPPGNHENRWNNHDELRYSLRSLSVFAPWIRRIHVVTNGQCPSWLNLDSPKVQLVTHEQIYRWPEHLPTFNSISIETHLHRIPNLAEHFLYFNDDMFLGGVCTPDMFFDHAGNMRVERKGELPRSFSRRDKLWKVGLVKARRLLDDVFENPRYHRLNHQAKPYTKSFLQWVESQWLEVSYANSAERFRSPHCVAMNYAFWLNCAEAMGFAVQCKTESLAITLNGKPRADQRQLDRLRRMQCNMFCINDASRDRDIGPLLHEFFESYFPIPSEYER
jgi:hypothetical protein